MFQHAQSIAGKNIHESIQSVFQSILRQIKPNGDEVSHDVIGLLQHFRDIWKRKLVDKGYESDVVNEWFVFLDVLDGAAVNTNLLGRLYHQTNTRTQIISATSQSTTAFDTETSVLADYQNHQAESTRQPYSTAWAKLRHLNRRHDLLSEEAEDALPMSKSTETISRIMEQLDMYGYKNETYWIKDTYPSIQKYSDEQIDVRLHYTSSSNTNATTKPSIEQQHPVANDDDESLRLLLLVDRKRKSVNKKKLLWDTSSQRYLSKEPPKKRIKTKSNHGSDDNLDSMENGHQRTILLPDIPRMPYNDNDFDGTLSWKASLDRLHSSGELNEFIHHSQSPSQELEMHRTTSLLLGSICDAGQYHFFLQSYSSQSSNGEHVNKRLQRKAIRTRLGSHIPIRISDDIHGRASSDTNNSKPWSKVLRTMSLSQNETSDSNDAPVTSTTEGMTNNGAIQIVERLPFNRCDTDSPRVEVEQKPHYWFDFDTGYCVLEYVVEGTRRVCAFSNIELSLSDE